MGSEWMIGWLEDLSVLQIGLALVGSVLGVLALRFILRLTARMIKLGCLVLLAGLTITAVVNWLG
jgi:hypothetical protein